jgi:predicted alpha/beta superfamily hydrolase
MVSRLKTGALVVVALLVAAAAGGLVGGGAAVALIRTAYNGPVASARLPEVLVSSVELGEPVTLGVHVPLEYEADPSRAFPVLWVLDGPSQGKQVARTMQTLSRIGIAEPSIVVEVPSSSRGRSADFIPPWENGSPDAQADRFHRFLVHEAIPAVAERYRVGNTRVLVGHSLGGLFTLYALLQEPSLFDGYFAFSPAVWVRDRQILTDLERAGTSLSVVPTNLFLSLGATEGNRMLSGFEAVEGILESWPASGLRWKATITEGADHGTNPELSFPVAMQWYSRR